MYRAFTTLVLIVSSHTRELSGETTPHNPSKRSQLWLALEGSGNLPLILNTVNSSCIHNKEIIMPVKPRKDESEQDFIARCVPRVIREGYPQDQAIAICYTYWKNKKSKKE